MIVIKVELHSAVTGQVKELSRVIIDNLGGTNSRGDYRCRSYRKGSPLYETTKNIVREGEVLNHARLAEPVLNLVAKALKVMGYK